MIYLVSFLAVIIAAACYYKAVILYIRKEQRGKDLANRKVTTTLPEDRPEFNEWAKYIHNLN